MNRVMFALSAGLIAVLAATVLHVGLAASDQDVEEADQTETLSLHPGDNFVGWVSDAKPVAEIFAEIPRAQLIYRWDAEWREYRYASREGGGSLDTLDSGMAAIIRISGRKSVEWRRPLTPSKGVVTLHSGENWVAWNGRDEWPLEQAARAIGKSLVSIEVRGLAYQPDSETSEAIQPLTGESAIRRGDALRVTVNRDLRWLQPTGMMPKIVWLGDISQSLRDEIIAEVARVLDFFAEQFAVESDFADTTLLFYNSIDAVVEHAVAGAEPRFTSPPEWLRGSLLSGRTGQAEPWGFFMSVCGWQSPKPQPCHGRTTETLTHEWFHVIQSQLSARVPQASPTWINEGAATWAEWQMPTGLRSSSADDERGWRRDRVARIGAPLQSAEDGYHGWEYDLGALAVEQLVERSGPDAQIEFNRLLYPQIIGQERLWAQGLPWPVAFQTAFGITAATFYEEFADWRETLPAPTQRLNYNPNDVGLSGTLHHSNGSSAAGFVVIAEAYEDEVKVGIERATIVDEQGTFTLYLEPGTMQRVRLKRAGCQLWLGQNGLATTYPQPGQHRALNTRSLPSLNLTLPEGACENELRAHVTRLRGDERSMQVLLIDHETHDWRHMALGPSGTFVSFAPEPGAYRVGVHLAGCRLWYTTDGLVASRESAYVLELSDEPISIEFRIPHTLCQRQISGRIVDESDNPVAGAWPQAVNGHLSSWAQTTANGEFTFTVAVSGEYVLQLWSGDQGCWIQHSTSGATPDWQQATAIPVQDEDVTGIEFVVPANPSSLCP